MKHVVLTLSFTLMAFVTAWGEEAAPPANVSAAPPACEAGPECVKKVCVPQPAKKKTEKIIYDVKCEDYCLPRCTCWGWFHPGCDTCAAGNCAKCSKPRVKHILVKKKITKECDTFKCVPQPVPAKPACSQDVAPLDLEPSPPDGSAPPLLLPSLTPGK